MPTHEAFERAEAGEFKLGGCCIIEGGPDRYCNDCELEWSRQEAIDYAYSQIKTIKASVGGYFGGYYNVEIDLTTQKLTWSHLGGGAEESIKKTIRSTTAKRLIDEFKRVNLLDWKSKYIEPEVCDGTQWSIEIILDGRISKKRGDNKFPDEWDEFCKFISRIAGRKFL